MTGVHIVAQPPMTGRHHVALHLAHRWFAFLEAPGGELDANGGNPAELRAVRLKLTDDVRATIPTVDKVQPLALQ